MLIGIDANEANITRRVGVNQYAFGLIRAISGLETGHSFTVYLKQSPLSDMPPEKSNWHYRVIPFPKLWTRTRLPWDLYTHHPGPEVFFTPSHYAPRWSPAPTVISVMDLGFLQSPEQFTPRDFNQLKNWTAYSAAHASKIICISENTKKDILNNYHRQSGDVIVTYPGFDTHLFKPTRDTGVLRKYSINEPYILFLGSLKPSKNVEGLIRAFAGLHRPDLKLVIAGKKAWMYESVYGLAGSLKLTDRIIFTGFVPDADVPALISGALAFVLPSFWEGFGIPVLEAMACGTPVVVSRVASLPEVAGEAGIYVNPRDSASIAAGIRTAIGPARDKYIGLGLQQVKKFSWDKTALESVRI
jgi:glycosyltransferase involved in cell wall biosynthesis